MRRRSLKTRLTLSHVLVTLAGLALLSAALLGLIYRSQRADTLTNLAAQAQVYAAFAADVAPDTDALAGIAPGLVRRFSPASDTAVRVLAPNGAVLYASRDLGDFPSASALPLLTNPLPIQPVALEQGRRFVARPVLRGDQTIGVIELSQGVERERALFRQLGLALVPSVLLALSGAAVAGYLLAGGLVRPLRRLERVAAAIAEGDGQARSEDRSPDEIGQLAARLNTMADELQARLVEMQRLAAARQEFYRSVSHELRTPLTAIRGTAENLEDEVEAEQQAALAIIQTEAARLQRLVEELLNPRDSTPAPLRRRQPVDLSALVDEVAQIMRPRAERSGIRLSSSAEPQLVVTGDRDRLKQALLNLLDNAISWTQPGGSVALRAARQQAEARVLVRDSGPGIPPEQRERVWQRGVSGSGGQGLGLALVREVIGAHGGQAMILDGPGATIEVRLPLA